MNGVSTETIVAVAAAAASGSCALASLMLLWRVRARSRSLDAEIERGRAQFDAVVAQEAVERAEDLRRTLTRLRAEALSELATEERRIAEERRELVAQREKEASNALSAQLAAVQRSVEQRMLEWKGDVEKLQVSLTEELARIETRQRHLMSDADSKIGRDAEAVQAEIDQQKQLLARLRDELTRAAHDASQTANAELEAHAAERRRALHEVADRMRKRETSLRELVDREGTEAAQRIQVGLGDIERRQIEQLQRLIDRATTRYSEAAQQQFETTIRAAREEAARRLGRELDIAVERFAREAESVLSERLNQTGDAAAARVEERLSRLRANLERQRDDAFTSIEERAHLVEAELRDRLQEIAADAETERAAIEARLHELSRRVEEIATRN